MNLICGLGHPYSQSNGQKILVSYITYGMSSQVLFSYAYWDHKLGFTINKDYKMAYILLSIQQDTQEKHVSVINYHQLVELKEFCTP